MRCYTLAFPRRRRKPAAVAVRRTAPYRVSLSPAQLAKSGCYSRELGTNELSGHVAFGAQAYGILDDDHDGMPTWWELTMG